MTDKEPFCPGIYPCECSLWAEDAARELDAVGEGGLSKRMYQDMTHREASTFGEELRAAADRLQARFAGTPEHGDAERSRSQDKDENEQIHGRVTIDHALAEIRAAARWYERVGKLGFGTHAWGL